MHALALWRGQGFLGVANDVEGRGRAGAPWGGRGGEKEDECEEEEKEDECEEGEDESEEDDYDDDATLSEDEAEDGEKLRLDIPAEAFTQPWSLASASDRRETTNLSNSRGCSSLLKSFLPSPQKQRGQHVDHIRAFSNDTQALPLSGVL